MTSDLALKLQLLLAFLAATPVQTNFAAAGDVIGEWRGTSLCTNRQIAPACKDEQVHFVFSKWNSSSGTMHVDARKLVDGKYQSMGEMDLEYAASTDTWSHRLENPGHQATWSFHVVGGELDGTLADQASGAQIRKVSAKRWAQ